MLPFPINLGAPRMWLRPAGAGPGELACGLVVAGQVRWLRARLSGDHVLFDELEPRTNPTKWKPAQPAAVSQAERALRAVTPAKRRPCRETERGSRSHRGDKRAQAMTGLTRARDESLAAVNADGSPTDGSESG